MEMVSNYFSSDSSDVNVIDSSTLNDGIYNTDFKIKVISWAKKHTVHSSSVKYKISRIFIRKWIQNEAKIQEQIKLDPIKEIDQILMDLMKEDDNNNQSHKSRSRSTAKLKSALTTDENNNSNTRHRVHEESPAELICDFQDCGKKFISKGGFQNHRLLHLPNAKQFVCTFPNCTKVFKQSSGLSHHKKVHSKNEFACDQCIKAFRTQAKLNSHGRREHSPGKLFSCPELDCEKSFKHSSSLTRHRRTRHHERQDDPKSNLTNVNKGILRYQCQHCSKSYQSKSYLKFHNTRKH